MLYNAPTPLLVADLIAATPRWGLTVPLDPAQRAGVVGRRPEQRVCLFSSRDLASGGMIPPSKWPPPGVTNRLVDVCDLVALLLETNFKKAA